MNQGNWDSRMSGSYGRQGHEHEYDRGFSAYAPHDQDDSRRRWAGESRPNWSGREQEWRGEGRDRGYAGASYSGGYGRSSEGDRYGRPSGERFDGQSSQGRGYSGFEDGEEFGRGASGRYPGQSRGEFAGGRAAYRGGHENEIVDAPRRDWGGPSYGRTGLGGGSGYSSMGTYGWSDFDSADTSGGWRTHRGSSGPGWSGSSSMGAGTQQRERVDHTGRGPKGYRRGDERIQEDVSERLKENCDLDASEIEVKVQSGIVTLSGSVSDRRAKRLAEQCAENVSGVDDVTNQIKVSSSRESDSRSDDSNRGKSANGSSSKASDAQRAQTTSAGSQTSSSSSRS